MGEENAKSRFVRVYGNLSLDLRKEVIMIVEDEPISWNVAFGEIEGGTETGKKILKKMVEMDLI